MTAPKKLKLRSSKKKRPKGLKLRPRRTKEETPKEVPKKGPTKDDIELAKQIEMLLELYSGSMTMTDFNIRMRMGGASRDFTEEEILRAGATMPHVHITRYSCSRHDPMNPTGLQIYWRRRG